MEIKIDMTKEPYENCPAFKDCSYNKCSLHKDFEKLKSLPEDLDLDGYKSKRCRLTKSKRIRIAKAFNLRNLGLRPRERHGLLRWNSLSEKEKQEKRDRMRAIQQNNPTLYADEKGGIQTPPKQVYAQKPPKTPLKQEERGYSGGIGE